MGIIKMIKDKGIMLTALFVTVAVLMMVGLLLSIFYTNNTKIGGTLYNEIILTTNLTADILPPPQCIIESYAVALEYQNENDTEVQQELYAKFKELQVIYEERHDYWVENLPVDEELNKAFLVDSHIAAEKFFQIFYDEVVPAVEKGDKTAIKQAKINIQGAYYEHRSAIDKTIEISSQWRERVFSDSDEIGNHTKNLMIILIFFMLFVAIIFSFAISRSEQALLKLVYYDGLTGLPCRRMIVDKLENLVRVSTDNNTGFAVVFLDLDGFKNVNDTLGHDAGDRLLQDVAIRFSSLKRPDDILGRLSGDEFTLIVMGELNEIEMLEYIGKWKDAVLEPFMINKEQVHLSASFGISFFPQDGSSSKELLVHADKAMYSAKNAGKNEIKFYSK